MDREAQSLFGRLLDALGLRDADCTSSRPDALPLRMPVQDVQRSGDRHIVLGRIETGRVGIGDRVLFSPSNRNACVAGIEAQNMSVPLTEAVAGQSIRLTLDEPLSVERGETLSHEDWPPVETDVFRAWLLWLGPTPLKPGERCTLRLGTAGVEVEVQSIDRAIDPGERGKTETPDEVLLNGIAEVVLRSRAMLALDAFMDNPVTGRFLLADENEIVGAGLIGMEGYPDQRALGFIHFI